jgi:hypothetical protein
VQKNELVDFTVTQAVAAAFGSSVTQLRRPAVTQLHLMVEPQQIRGIVIAMLL